MKFLITSCGLLAFLGWFQLEKGISYPAHFPEPTYNFSQNPLREEAVSLGRSLFYEPLLSRDNSISCASCHSSFHAFAHTDHDLSHGIDDQMGTRNAPPLFNLAWKTSFMWDGAINHLDMQALAPISHPQEMGESLANVIVKLQTHEQYPARFVAAFPGEYASETEAITGEHLLKALSQFQLTLVSAQAKYDSVQAGTSSFSQQEQQGYTLFQQHCNHCHTEPLFTNGGFADNGLPIDSTLNDVGREMISQQEEDRFHFQVPSLRNLSYTYPYMHDGRFRKLSQVLKHYATGVHSRTDSQAGLNRNLPLSSRDRADLIAFLLTLNDREFVFHPDHQFPREAIPAVDASPSP